jgi:hypothetical protein
MDDPRNRLRTDGSCRNMPQEDNRFTTIILPDRHDKE